MFYKLLILFHLLNIFSSEPSSDEKRVKAWIEIEGELNALSIKAKIENTSRKNLFLNYELETHNYTRIKDKRTLQKGKFLALKQSVTALSESRLNVTGTRELCIQIKVFCEDRVVAADSVVFHAAL